MESQGIYVRKIPYTTGGIVQSASSLSHGEFRDLESSLMGVPKFPDIRLNITAEQIKLMTVMMNHVTINSPILPRSFLHVQTAYKLAMELSGENECNLDIDKCVAAIEEKCTNYSSLKCNCEGHSRLRMRNDDELVFEACLGQLQLLDVREKLKDQSGAHVMNEILFLLSLKHNWRARCSTKSATLQTAFAMYNAEKGIVKLYNSTPDFIMTTEGGATLVVGEVESSPFQQMLVAGIGHIADQHMKYMLGITLSKQRCIDLYFIQKDDGMKIHCDQLYTGKVSVKKLSTDMYCLLDEKKLQDCLKQIVSVLSYIADEYEERTDSLREMALTHSVSSPTVRRRSERKRKAASTSTDKFKTC